MLNAKSWKRVAVVFAAAIGPAVLSGCTTPKPTVPTDSAAQKAADDAKKFTAQVPAPSPAAAPVDVEPGAVKHHKLVAVAPIKPEPKPAPAPVTPPPPPPAPVVVPVAKPKPLSTAQLVEQLSERLKKAPQNGLFRRYLAEAALTLIDPSRELTAADLAGLSDDDRKLLLAYQRTFTELARSMTGDAATDRQRLRSAAEELLEQLTASRRLSIVTAKLCTKVSGYGVYSAFTKNAFIAGRDQPVIVYAELEHFGTKLDDSGQNVARLTQRVALYNDADGLEVWNVKPTEIVDRSRNHRRDFFVVQIVTLPARLTVGKYRMKVTITDEVSQSVDEASIPIQIVADGDLAVKP